jgi:micrococcal nuclease
MHESRTRQHATRRRGLKPALLLVFLLGVAAASTAAQSSDVPSIPIAEASHHIGEVATVCGQVAGAAYFGSVKGTPTFLNLGRAYPDQLLTVVIWGSDRSRFPKPPENLFDGESICVTGEIESYRGKPEIVVDDPGQIVVTSERSSGGKLNEMENVLVKALLASLGYDANYGSGEWDQATIEAAISFQEASGIPPSGEPDPVTLRALAEKVTGIPEADRTMVIRMLLLELARRQE